MKRALIYSLAFTVPAVLLTAMPAQAQDTRDGYVAGSRIKKKNTAIDPDLVRKMSKAMGTCMYKHHSDDADRLLVSSDLEQVDYARFGHKPRDLWKLFTMEYCAEQDAMRTTQEKVQINFDGTDIRRMVIEEAYLAANATPLVLDETATEKVADRIIVGAVPSAYLKTMTTFADCIVHKDAAKADAVLREDPATDEEMTAVKALLPALGACLPQGQQMEITPKIVRELVAEGLWTRHYVQTTRAGSASAAPDTTKTNEG